MVGGVRHGIELRMRKAVRVSKRGKARRSGDRKDA
jgi:hypothetical protein